MSDVCRLELVWAPATSALPASVFYKRVVIGDLAHARMKAKTAPQKVIMMTYSVNWNIALLTHQVSSKFKIKSSLSHLYFKSDRKTTIHSWVYASTLTLK